MMIADETKARMYLSGTIENNGRVGDVYHFTHHILAPDGIVTECIKEDSYQLILPIEGSVSYYDSTGNRQRAQPGQCLRASVAANTTAEIRSVDNNRAHFVNIKLHQELFCSSNVSVAAFDEHSQRNELVLIAPALLMGSFDGRREASLTIRETDNIFVYVMHGAFEVQNRLVETGTGLALWNTGRIDMEALSEEAVVLLVIG